MDSRAGGFIPYNELVLDPSQKMPQGNLSVMKGALDCDEMGRIIFDVKSRDGNYRLKQFGGF